MFSCLCSAISVSVVSFLSDLIYLKSVHNNSNVLFLFTGQRFALLQIKIGLAMILKNFRVIPHETTPKSITIDPKRVTIVAETDLCLKTEML